jgi:hypothetical protein
MLLSTFLALTGSAGQPPVQASGTTATGSPCLPQVASVGRQGSCNQYKFFFSMKRTLGKLRKQDLLVTMEMAETA